MKFLYSVPKPSTFWPKMDFSERSERLTVKMLKSKLSLIVILTP